MGHGRSHIITTLQAKRDAIEATILAYQGKVDQARRDLAHVNATLALFAREVVQEIWTGAISGVSA